MTKTLHYLHNIANRSNTKVMGIKQTSKLFMLVDLSIAALTLVFPTTIAEDGTAALNEPFGFSSSK